MKKYSLIITIIMFPICLMYFFYLKNKADSNLKQIIEEYPGLTYNLALKGIVQQKIVGGELLSNGTVRIILNNGKFLMLDIAKNAEYDEPYFEEFIQVGDSIYKKIDNDTILVYRANKRYYFVLGQVINKE